MSKIAIVTDSKASIPPEAIQGLPIIVVPIQLIWGEQTFRDGIEIHPVEFYERLKNTTVMPSTSQPSPAAFEELYCRLLDEGHEILSIHISAHLSGTLQSATQAKANLPGAPIELVDSNTTAMEQGFLVLQAARAARQGASLQEVKSLVEELRDRSGVYFAVDTLEFLHRGGRIGGAAAFLGTVLNLKPLLKVEGGKIEAVEKVRTMSKALSRLLDQVEGQLNGNGALHICSIHANAPELAETLLQQARQRFGENRVSSAMLADVSPVIGTHTGPGCVGLCYLVEK